VWRERLRESGENPPVILAINKIDLLDGAPLDVATLRERFADFPELHFVSARTGDCIEQVFIAAAQLALADRDKATISANLVTQNKRKKEGCC
jgi:50S ribosomal subunit-associated GTPase HflX